MVCVKFATNCGAHFIDFKSSEFYAFTLAFLPKKFLSPFYVCRNLQISSTMDLSPSTLFILIEDDLGNHLFCVWRFSNLIVDFDYSLRYILSYIS